MEDEALIATYIESILFERGFKSFDFAVSSEEAIACAKRTCPDLITAPSFECHMYIMVL